MGVSDLQSAMLLTICKTIASEKGPRELEAPIGNCLPSPENSIARNRSYRSDRISGIAAVALPRSGLYASTSQANGDWEVSKRGWREGVGD